MPQSQILILMATFNGAAFLHEQLESIRAQTHKDWMIVARDDGSTDNTKEILARFNSQNPGKMIIVEDPSGNLGAAQNFFKLMEFANNTNVPYIGFSDQDDIWHPNKIEVSLEYMKRMEGKHGSERPLLVHHDFSTINKDGNIIDTSYNKTHRAKKEDTRLKRVFLQCTVHGLACMANHALIDKALPVPQNIDMHDYHMLRVATVFGGVGYIHEPLACYRLHDRNTVGINDAFHFTKADFSLRKCVNGHLLKLARGAFNELDARIKAKANIATEFLNRYRNEIPSQTIAMLEDFARLHDAGHIKRKTLILKNGFLPSNPLDALAFVTLA